MPPDQQLVTLTLFPEPVSPSLKARLRFLHSELIHKTKMAKSKTGIQEAFDKLKYNNAEDKYPQNSFFNGLEAPSR